MKYTFEIETDEYAQNPRNEFDNISTFYAVRNSRYLTGGKNDVEYTYRDSLEDEIKALKKAGAVIVEFSQNAGDQYAVVERSQLQDEYLKHGYTMRQALYYARQCAKGEIETWQAYAEGEVYGFVVKDENGETVDSCWGFYGESGRKEAESEAKSFIDWKIKDDVEQEKLFNVSMAL